jgi:hypothetical protein
LKVLKKTNLLLIGLGAVALGWFIYSKKQLADKTKLFLKKISFKNKKFNILFSIQNPTNETGTISAMTGEVYVNDKLVGDFSSFGQQKIAAKSQSDFSVVATPSIGVLQLLLSKGWLKGGVKYLVKGTANFDGIVAPFEFSQKVL